MRVRVKLEIVMSVPDFPGEKPLTDLQARGSAENLARQYFLGLEGTRPVIINTLCGDIRLVHVESAEVY